jgi:hypothetical protein
MSPVGSVISPRSDFHWDLPGLDRSCFAALSNLVSLRSGGMVSTARRIAYDSSDITDYDTGHWQQGNGRRRERLMEDFLNRFAELVQRSRDPSRIAATAIQEDARSVKMWVAINGEFSDMDIRFFLDFQSLLERLNRDRADTDGKSRQF